MFAFRRARLTHSDMKNIAVLVVLRGQRWFIFFFGNSHSACLLVRNIW